MVFVPHELPFQVVATGAMQGAGCADAGGGGGGNDDHLTPEEIQKIIKAMSKITGRQAPAGCHQSDEPASKKAKLWHPEDGMEALKIALNTLNEEQNICRDAMEQTIPAAGGGATAPAEAGGAGKALAETPQVAPAAQPPIKPAPEPTAAAALHSYPPKGPPPLPVGGSSASAGSAGAAPIPDVQEGGSSASSAPAANVAAVPFAAAAKAAADPAAATAASSGDAATTPATGPDQMIQWQLEQLQTQQQLVEQAPIPHKARPHQADLPATSSATTEVITIDTPQTSATHADASIGVPTGVPKACKSPPPVMQPPLTPPPPWQMQLAKAPPAKAPGAIAPAADGIPSANSFIGTGAIDTAGTVPAAVTGDISFYPYPCLAGVPGPCAPRQNMHLKRKRKLHVPLHRKQKPMSEQNIRRTIVFVLYSTSLYFLIVSLHISATQSGHFHRFLTTW